ncbi:hypothetical protein ACVWZW_003902 [Bradyrhizobium sp. F1.13.4]
MLAEDHVDFGMFLQFCECIRPGRVRQPILRLRRIDPGCYQRLLNQACDRVEDLLSADAGFTRYKPRAIQGEMADEGSDASEDDPVCVGQQIVAPIQCRLERPMSGNCRPMA